MTRSAYRILLIAVAVGFTIFFCATIIPALLIDKDIIGAFAAGFVNPYAAGYSTDVICCWIILILWILYEQKRYGQKHGWLCIILGLVPGVAVGLALYLLLRNKRMDASTKHPESTTS